MTRLQVAFLLPWPFRLDGERVGWRVVVLIRGCFHRSWDFFRRLVQNDIVCGWLSSDYFAVFPDGVVFEECSHLFEPSVLFRSVGVGSVALFVFEDCDYFDY